MGQEHRLGVASEVNLLLWIIEREGGNIVTEHLTCFPVNVASRFERLKKIFADARILGALAGKDEQNGRVRIGQVQYSRSFGR